jgi:hypothetical protein
MKHLLDGSAIALLEKLDKEGEVLMLRACMSIG